MKKTRYFLILILLTAIITSSLVFYVKKSETLLKEHKINLLDRIPDEFDEWLNGEDRESFPLVAEWIETYIMAQNEPFFRNGTITEYRMEGLQQIPSRDDSEHIIAYHVDLSWDSEKDTRYLFKTQGSRNDITNSLDFVIELELNQDTLFYYNDWTLAAYNQFYSPTQGESSLTGLYSYANENLEVRADEVSEWIKTPIKSSDFSLDHQNWFPDDQRLIFSGQQIGIVYVKDGNPSVAISEDMGETWTQSQILDKESDLGNVGFAHIDITQGKVNVVIKSYVALNSYISSYHKSLDFGKTWQTGPILNQNSHIYKVVTFDGDRIFYTKEDDNNLYYTDDLGAQVHEVVFEQTPTIEGSYKDSGLTWDQVYFQAELPTQEGDAYKIVLRQGKKGDNKYQSAIRYISYDKGETWSFVEHFIHKDIIEEVN